MYDVAIVGAGMAGMATAARLQAGGLSTIVLEAHALSDESTPDETQLSFPFDVPVGTHSAAKPCLGITRCTQPLRQGARTWFVEVSGCALAQGFVGPVVIVVVTPRIGASLLGFAIGQGLAGHLGLVA